MLVRILCIFVVSLIIDGYAYSSTPSSDDIILEENTNIRDAKPKVRVEAVVNSIQRDPFYRVLEQLGFNESRSIVDYDLSEFTLIGSVWDIAHPIAMFKGPKEKRYILKVGDRIGRNHGVVVWIGKGEAQIEEFFVDIDKNKIKKFTVKKAEKGV